MLAIVRRQQGLAGTSFGAVDLAMRTLGLEGVRRAKSIRTTTPTQPRIPANVREAHAKAN